MNDGAINSTLRLFHNQNKFRNYTCEARNCNQSCRLTAFYCARAHISDLKRHFHVHDAMWEFKHIKHMYRIICFRMNVCAVPYVCVCIEEIIRYIMAIIQCGNIFVMKTSMKHEWNSYNWYGIITVVMFCVK